MADYYIRFIPESIFCTLTQNEIGLIKSLNWGANIPEFISSENVQFADAGQNFEDVNCTSCGTNLTKWWGGAMSRAYSAEQGFFNLKSLTKYIYAGGTTPSAR